MFLFQFDAGVFESGNKTFTVKAFSTDVDEPEMIEWTGTSSVSSGENYLGSTTKTFNFSVSGTAGNTIGADSFTVTWTDSEGNTGTIDVTRLPILILPFSRELPYHSARAQSRWGHLFD